MPIKLSKYNLLRLDRRTENETRPISHSPNSSSSSLPSFHEPKRDRSWRGFTRRKFSYKNGSGNLTRRAAYRNRALVVLLIVVFLTGIAVIIWYSLVLALIRRLSPHGSTNGLENITSHWHRASDSMALLSPWPEDFSRDITPKNCHSHNDYTRGVPLYDALSAGCSSVEADIWLRHDGNGNPVLLVGHTSRSLTAQRSLNALYLDPLLSILDNQNSPGEYSSNDSTIAGIFSSSPNTTTVLLLDFKESSSTLFPEVVQALEPLRSKGYLTTYTNSTLTFGPLTIVASGDAEYADVISSTTYRDIFLDAPLESISDPMYNNTNSYYASVSIKSAVGYLWAGKFSSKQLATVNSQIQSASDKGLKSRYWDTVAWPIPWRIGTWRTLTDAGVGVLNVDDLQSATRWDWNVCVVAGFVLCGW